MRSNVINSLYPAALLSVGLVFVTSAPALGAKDACSLITAEDATAAIGEPVGPPKAESAYGPQGDGTVCKFKSTQGNAFHAKSVSITVHYIKDDVGGSNKGIEDNLKTAGFQNVHQVSGVGDSAVWGTMSMLGRPTGELTVLHGKHLMIIILINGVADEGTALDHAKVLAAKALSKA
jgi:hypothetical protein